MNFGVSETRVCPLHVTLPKMRQLGLFFRIFRVINFLSKRLPFNAVTAIETLGAARIGHGVRQISNLDLRARQVIRFSSQVQIIKDKKAMEAVKAHQVLLEVSVSSNYLCGCFPEGQHPARDLWDFGFSSLF